ncbi:MAG TPA: glycine--tRNA ligase subunit beta [Steroidobacteraceae bacterium]|nr:glycine--tRNA ligase subunit beta [Steroidobacteraceae bacterium]
MSTPARDGRRSDARRSDARRDLLVELGTEELPPKDLPTLEQAFAEALSTRLRDLNLKFSAVQSFATPRRLALLVRRLSLHQPDQQITRRGPPRTVSFDAAGAPTRAALAFASSCAVPWESLSTERDANGNEYLHYSGVRRGAATASLLPGLVQAALNALPIPRRMRWGELDAQFVRPVHWLLLLLGSELVPAEMFGIMAGRTSRGHRFMAPAALHIRSGASYAATLQQRGKVLAVFDQRRQHLRAQVESLAQSLQGRAIVPDALLDEVTALVEWPVAIAGQFDTRFLALPREVLISTLQDHQRYFALERAGGELLPWFITVSNIDSPEPEVIRSGNERVVRPRLADAEFFWAQDRRQPLSARLAGLRQMTFEAQLGSQADRTQRIAVLAETIAAAVGADPGASVRAALLCKCDLSTAMVREFPELQGLMGRYYALADGEPAAVAEAIREHYLPRGAGDALPASPIGDAVALADKIDVLAGIFAIGQKPSGTRDPYGLRRAAIGLLRIVLEHRLDLDLPALLDRAIALQPLPDMSSRAASLATEIYEFVLERLRAQYLESRDSNGMSTEMFDAVLATRPRSLLDFDARLRALVQFVARPEGASLAAANKRIANILRKSAEVAAPAIAPELLREAAERELHRVLESIRAQLEAAIAARRYAEALDLLAGSSGAVDQFFDRVLVNDPDPALRGNRLALLSQLRALFGGIADLSRLPG